MFHRRSKTKWFPPPSFRKGPQDTLNLVPRTLRHGREDFSREFGICLSACQLYPAILSTSGSPCFQVPGPRSQLLVFPWLDDINIQNYPPPGIHRFWFLPPIWDFEIPIVSYFCGSFLHLIMLLRLHSGHLKALVILGRHLGSKSPQRPSPKASTQEFTPFFPASPDPSLFYLPPSCRQKLSGSFIFFFCGFSPDTLNRDFAGQVFLYMVTYNQCLAHSGHLNTYTIDVCLITFLIASMDGWVRFISFSCM